MMIHFALRSQALGNGSSSDCRFLATKLTVRIAVSRETELQRQNERLELLLNLTTRITSRDRKSTRLNSSHGYISYAVFCLKKKNTIIVRADPIASTL